MVSSRVPLEHSLRAAMRVLHAHGLQSRGEKVEWRKRVRAMWPPNYNFDANKIVRVLRVVNEPCNVDTSRRLKQCANCCERMREWYAMVGELHQPC